MGRKEDLIRELQKFARDIAEEYPLQKMILFGSRATGKATKGSDVDLILVSSGFRKKRSLQRASPLYLKWTLNYPVDFLCYTPQEFSRKKKRVGIVQDAMEEGITILDT